MPRITEEQKKQAKKVDLLTYLQANEPHELVKSGSNEYRMATHGSLVISNGLWMWNRRQIGGKSALDYLMKVRGMSFVEAVEKVLNSPVAWLSNMSLDGQTDDFRSAATSLGHVSFCQPCDASFALPVGKAMRQKEKKKLFLPKPVSVPHKVVKYLRQRGIHSDVIGQCLKTGLLYESIYKNKKEPDLDGSEVCVFVGRDDTGVTRFAAQRGIYTNFKRDVPGSDKTFSFTFPAQNPNSRDLAVFEAPMDLLSHTSLVRLGYLEFEGHRLSLGGTADVALIAYLERNPNIEHVLLCLDNDAGGLNAVDKIAATLFSDERFNHINITIDLPKERGHDYNDELLQVLQSIKEHKPSSLNYVSGRC